MLQLCPSQSKIYNNIHGPVSPIYQPKLRRGASLVRASEGNPADSGDQKKQSLLSTVTDALDFSQVRSEEDAVLLEEARFATKAGVKMTREQYGALRRKIGGTYQDFFKSYVEVDGEYVEDGWVDKTCKICKKDTSNQASTVDSMGRYAHVECLQNQKERPTNIFSWLFGR